MKVYEALPIEMQENIKNYKKISEITLVSKEAVYRGEKFREVKFSSKHLKKLMGEVKGYVYIDEKNQVVTDPKLINKLARLFYFLEILCDDDSSISLNRAIQSELDLNRDKSECDDCEAAIDILVDKGYQDSSAIKPIFSRIHDLKVYNNEKLILATNKAEELFNSKGYLDEELVEEMQPYYLEALESNFDKIKYIYSVSSNFETIKDYTKKLRRGLKMKLKSRRVIILSKLEYMLQYLIKILITYDAITKMSKAQYAKKLQGVEKQNIEYRVNLVRNIK